ncbi:MAG: hypothetical protein JJU05_02260 [Verrucomicrobia bacterium]|nr:hypothetical protein [Verrucomicrobiota bacterium]MCH8528093.1 hypothetical protein [Kiritimatiellia bacterium]
MQAKTRLVSRTIHQDRTGSALLVTILVVSLLLVMVLALSAVVRLELRKVTNHHHHLQAKANARLGADLALARLQEWMGPDERVTARGELLTHGGDNLSGLALSAEAKRRVGVWRSDAYREFDPAVHAEEGFMGWLISGMDGADHLTSLMPPLGGIQLVGPGSAGEEPEDHVNAIRVTWDSGRQGYAWMVDDHGLKAKLTPRHRNVTEGNPEGGGVIPGAYPLDRLNAFSETEWMDPEGLEKVNSLRDLVLLGAEGEVVGQRFYDFTTVSLGVLSDNRNGGLKRDLTIAFENETVFSRVFPNDDQTRYLLLDPAKRLLTADLRNNGYIHWDIFRDYYNMKDHIVRFNGMDALDVHTFDKTDLFQGTHAIARGRLAPHEMGPARNPSSQREQPYGDLRVSTGTNTSGAYKHNHFASIFSFMQQTAWVEYVHPEPVEDGGDPGPGRLSTHVQIWTSLYNPYNIGMVIQGTASRGPRIHNFPQVYFHIPEVVMTSGPNRFASEPGAQGFRPWASGGASRESHAQSPALLGPGRSQVYGVEQTGESIQMGNSQLFGPNVRENIQANARESYSIVPFEESGLVNLRVMFRVLRDSQSETLMHGADWHPPHPVLGDTEISQVIYSPFVWDPDQRFSAKTYHEEVPWEELNENLKFSVQMNLRTTRESPNDALRPLIDANIRAPWVNPRWDSSLPVLLSAPAVYSGANQGEPDQEFPQMEPGGGGTGFSFMGADTTLPGGHARMVLFDIPREDLVSLGQLQHASAGRFSYEPSYIAGNSYANPRIPRNNWRASITDSFSPRHNLNSRISGSFNLYDASYLVNEMLWDRHVFTTLPQVRSNYTPGEPEYEFPLLLSGEQVLPNPRFIPYVPGGSEFSESVLRDTGDEDGTEGSFFHNAGHLLVDGPFNVNSTSVEAWEAFLTGTLELPVQEVNEQGEITGFRSTREERVRFPRVKSVFGSDMDRNAPDENYWTGFRSLRQAEVRALAEEIVNQVRRRGPFLNMGQFVNRMLVNNELGDAGVLQAALDSTVNQGLSTAYELPAGGAGGSGTQGAGFPGQLLQGDLLQALSPMMSVRSDTFVIRSYGEVRDGTGGGAHARAWCEVLVQRVPDPVRPPDGGVSTLADLSHPPGPFGRQFRILSFRWLHENEI